MLVAKGLAAPLPDWVGVLAAAHRLRCPPWELADDPEMPNKRWWAHKALVMNAAEAIAHERQMAEAKSKSKATR